MKKELQAKEEEMNKKINDAIIKERKNLSARQKMDIENLRKQQQKEIDVIIHQFIQKLSNLFFILRQFIKLLLIQLLIDHVLNH
jgi:hypothetical protein